MVDDATDWRTDQRISGRVARCVLRRNGWRNGSTDVEIRFSVSPSAAAACSSAAMDQLIAKSVSPFRPEGIRCLPPYSRRWWAAMSRLARRRCVNGLARSGRRPVTRSASRRPPPGRGHHAVTAVTAVEVQPFDLLVRADDGPVVGRERVLACPEMHLVFLERPGDLFPERAKPGDPFQHLEREVRVGLDVVHWLHRLLVALRPGQRGAAAFGPPVRAGVLVDGHGRVLGDARMAADGHPVPPQVHERQVDPQKARQALRVRTGGEHHRARVDRPCICLNPDDTGFVAAKIDRP